MDLTIGMRVLYTDEPVYGSFEATVKEFVTVGQYKKDPNVKNANDISQAVLEPTDPAVRAYVGERYVLGRAHWEGSLTILEPAQNESEEDA